MLHADRDRSGGEAVRRILSIDPGMTNTGYAVLDGPDFVVEAGLLQPDALADPIDRLRSMVKDARELVRTHDIMEVVVETPMDAMYGNFSPRSLVSLPWYGIAIGAFVFGITGVPVVTVSASTWGRHYPRGAKGTKEYRDKAARVELVSTLYPKIKMPTSRSKAAGMVDAILIGRWWMFERHARWSHR